MLRSFLRAVPLALALPSAAFAGGFESEYADNNARVLGRGGAFAARADDPSAIQYNPAGLAKLKGFNVLLSVNVLDVNQTFQPASDKVLGGRSTRRFAPLEQEIDLTAAPMLALHFDFEALPDFDFAVGVYGPSGTTHRRFANQFRIQSVTRDADGADQLDRIRGQQGNALAPNGVLVESQMIQAYPTVAVAWSGVKNLRVGVSLQASVVDATIKKAIGGPIPGVAELQFTDPFTFTAIAGVQYDVTEWLELGVMYRPSFENVATGTHSLRRFNECPNGDCPDDVSDEPLGPYGLGAEVPFSNADGSPNQDLEFRFTNPDILRFGARYIDPRFDIEFNYVFQRQSVHKAFGVDYKAPRATLDDVVVEPVPDVADRRDYQDTHGFRLGGDIIVLPEQLSVRWGGSYENGSSPEDFTSLDFPGLDQWSVAVGLTWHTKLVDIDLAYSHIGLIDRTVEEGNPSLIDITVAADQWKAVNKGDYSGNYNVFGLGTTWHFGE